MKLIQFSSSDSNRIADLLDVDVIHWGEPNLIGCLWYLYRDTVGSDMALMMAPCVLRDETGKGLASALLRALDGKDAWASGNVLKLAITKPSISGNEFNTWTHRNFKKTKHKEEMIQLVQDSLARVGRKAPRPHVGSFVWIRIHRCGVKGLDYDNLVTGCKYLIDALAYHGLIVDDSPEHILTTYTQQKEKKGRRRTEIHLAWET